MVRGIIDLLLVAADKATVIERLDGPPSAEHRNQMEIRLEAVEASAPGSRYRLREESTRAGPGVGRSSCSFRAKG